MLVGISKTIAATTALHSASAIYGKRTSALHHSVGPRPMKLEAVRQSALSVFTQEIPVRSLSAVVEVSDVNNPMTFHRVTPHLSLGLC